MPTPGSVVKMKSLVSTPRMPIIGVGPYAVPCGRMFAFGMTLPRSVTLERPCCSNCAPETAVIARAVSCRFSRRYCAVTTTSCSAL